MHWLFERVSVLPNTFLLAWGWQRRILCLACGAATALSLPPFNFSLVLLISFPCLVWLLDGALEPGAGNRSRRLRTGFALGWLFGFGYFLAGLWWIGAAFLVEADRFAWLMPLAVLAMPVGLALFTGAGVSLAALLWSDKFRRILLLAACLTLANWVRGNVLTGFPWNSFGYGVSELLILAQSASLVGIYGLTFLVVAVSAAPAVLADTRPLQGKLAVVALAGATFMAVFIYGTLRLISADTQYTDMDIRIVQPSIAQEDKWRPELRDEIFRTYLKMTESPLGGSARVGASRLVVWPESAVPFLLTQEPGALFQIGNVLGERTELVTGAIRAEAGADGHEYYNSVYLIDSHGTVDGIYDKVRLVPFGEFVPLESLLKKIGITTLAGPSFGFHAGYQRRVLTTSEGFSFQPLICYEIIYPGSISGQTTRPDYLLNVTNDAWFGRTPGPFQHLAQARMRAVESGLPVVRAANTGISAVIDGKGVILEQLQIFEKGIIDTKLPQSTAKTPYGTLGDIPVLFISILIVVFAIFSQYNRDSRVN